MIYIDINFILYTSDIKYNLKEFHLQQPKQTASMNTFLLNKNMSFMEKLFSFIKGTKENLHKWSMLIDKEVQYHEGKLPKFMN